MTFGQSIKTVFGNLTNFQGRARRSEFWWFELFMFLISIPLGFVLSIPLIAWAGSLGGTFGQDDTLTDEQAHQLIVAIAVTYGLAFLFGLITFFLTLSVWVRRLHDVGYSGHLLWLALIGLSIVPFIFAILEGNRGPNKYGPDPKAVEGGPWPHAQQMSPTYAQPPAYPASPTYGQPPTQAPPAYQPPPLDPGPDMIPPTPASGNDADPFAAPPRQS
jgi:uncharacterized membrane protein YhaH (DUF805 family)